jgi:hypothetical protein
MQKNICSQNIPERREYPRTSCQSTVRIYADPSPSADYFDLEAANIGPTGMFLRSELLFPVGEWLPLEFTHPEGTAPLRHWGMVVRVNTTEANPGPGMAIQLHPQV